MNSKLEMARPKLALVDWGWISAALIFLALMCFCILFFVKGVNDLSATQTESLLRTPAPVAVTQAEPEPNPEVLSPQQLLFRRKGNFDQAKPWRPRASSLC